MEPPGDEKGDEYNALEHFQELMVEGLRLLAKLVSDEEWCRVIAEKEGLLAKIMVPLRSDMHHTKYHSVCSDSERPICREMIGASIQVMRQSGDYSWRHRRDGTLWNLRQHGRNDQPGEYCPLRPMR